MTSHSNHIFMFPFSLKGCGNIDKIRTEILNDEWVRDKFHYTKGDFAENFSLQAYFYEFAIGALVDDDTPNSIIETYQKTIGDDAKYIIEISKKQESEAKRYVLFIEKISLSFYDGKVAILSFHLSNFAYKELDDILAINDYGRRIYPLYFRLGPNGEVDLTEVKSKILPDQITLDLGTRNKIFTEDFNKYTIKHEHPFMLPNHITGILPPLLHNVHWLQDDRMYVITWYGNDEFATSLNLPFTHEAISHAFSSKGDEYINYDRWYRYVHIYKSNHTHYSQSRFTEQINKTTYDRWANQGSLYGVSRYSFVSLTDTKGYGMGRRYMRSMYYHMASLCLAQRTLILYFSNEISDITARLSNQSKKNKEGYFDEIKKLNLDFIRFKNNIYFREVSTQAQGVELYNMMHEQMEIESDVNELKSEIEQLYQYINMDGDQLRNEKAQLLNQLAVIALPLTIVIGVFSMNDFTEITSNTGTYIELFFAGFACFIVWIVIILKSKI